METWGPLICLDNGLFQVVNGERGRNSFVTGSKQLLWQLTCRVLLLCPLEVWRASFREGSRKGGRPPRDLRGKPRPKVSSGHKYFVCHTTDYENLGRQLGCLNYRTKQCVWTKPKRKVDTGMLILGGRPIIGADTWKFDVYRHRPFFLIQRAFILFSHL